MKTRWPTSTGLVMLLFAPLVSSGQTLAEAINLTNHVVATGGTTPWTVQTSVTRDGSAGQSGWLSSYNQESWIELTVTNAGTISFWWKNSGLDWNNPLSFTCNGNLVASIKGEVDWQYQTLQAWSGHNVFRWKRRRETMTVAGQQRAWLDQVAFDPTPPTAPIILSHPQSTKVSEGFAAGLTIDAVGVPEPTLQWLRDGVPLPNATNRTLSFDSTKTSDAGVYSVIASNSIAAVTSSNAVLTVIPAMPLGPILTNWPGFERSAALSVAVNGSYAYVGGYYWGSAGFFAVFDISDPSRPNLVGSLNIEEDNVLDLFVVSNYVYAARGSGGLSIIDVSDAVHPVIVGTADTDGWAHGVYVKGNYAYVADDDGGLAIIDIGNPAAPVNIAQRSTANYAKRVAVKGDYAYVATWYSGITVFDVSNPANPVTAAFLPWAGAGWYRVATVGDYLYATSGSAGLCVFDISNPTDLVLAGGLDVPAWEIVIAGDRAYLSGALEDQAETVGFLRVLDIRNPAEPVVLGSTATKDWTEAMAVSGDQVYLANWNGGLQIISVADPAHPAKAAEFSTYGNSYGVDICGNLAFLADVDNGVHILDISNPLQPRYVSTFHAADWCNKVQVVGHRMYATDWDGGLRIVDISNPAQPREIGTYLSESVFNLHVDGGYAYLAADDFGLHIVDITDPTRPVKVNGANTFGNVCAVKVRGAYAYLAGFDGSLKIVNVSDPALPVLVGSLNIPGNAEDLFLDGDYLYVQGTIVDISNPSTPAQVGKYREPSWMGDVIVANGYAMVSGDPLMLIDVSDPTQTATVGTIPLPPYAESDGLKIAGEYAYLAEGSWGLGVVSVPPNLAAPLIITHDPAGQTVNAGDEAFLAVNAVGQPPLRYQWFFNNSPLSGATNWILRLADVEYPHTGDYHVVVNDSHGSVTSAVATLTVDLPLRIVTTGSQACGFTSSNTFQLVFRGQPGTNYVVEYVDSLEDANWKLLTSVVGVGTPSRVIDPAGPGKGRFFRVRQIVTQGVSGQ